MVEVLVIILLVLGLGGLIESLIALSFPKWSLKICKKMGLGKFFKNEKIIRKWASWELVIAIILLLIAINM